jgi:hypothetical protein
LEFAQRFYTLPKRRAKLANPNGGGIDTTWNGTK